MFWVRRFCFSAPVKKPARSFCSPRMSATAQCARWSIRRHWLKMTAFRSWSITSWRTSWRSSSSLGAESPLSTLSSGVRRADRRPDVLELELGQPVGDDPLGRQQAHQPEELDLGQRTLQRDLHELGDRLIEGVVLLHLGLGHLDRHADVGAGRKLVEHFLADPADHAGPQPLPDGVEMAHAGDLLAAVASASRAGPGSRHLGSSAESSTHSTIEASSSIRFSIGVPVSTSRYGGLSPLTESAVLVAQFLIRCASSSTTRSGFQPRTVSRSRINCS